MILQALTEYYESLVKDFKVAKLGWCHAKVSYAIDLSEEGDIKGIILLKEEITKGKKTIWKPTLVMVPEQNTRTGKKAYESAYFLCDSPEYLLGISSKNKENEKYFISSKEKHLQLLQNVDSKIAKAICNFFEKWSPEKAKQDKIIQENFEEITEGGNLIFCMSGIYAHEDNAIKKAWDEYTLKDDLGIEGICLVTGQKNKIARLHRGIKGVPGSQSSGAMLVSFNAPAFESYGKEQSYNAPVGKYAEFAYTTALNYLLNQKEYAMPLGDMMVVFWTETGEKKYQATFWESVNSPKDNQKEIAKILEKINSQKNIDVEGIEFDLEQKFYILGLAPNAARLSVRIFYENSFGSILKNISKYYEELDIVRPIWVDNEYLGIKKLLDATANMKAKEKKPIPNMAAMLFQSIVSGNKYPERLYTDLIIRIRAEQGNVDWKRAAIIKAFLIRNRQWKEGERFMGLNEECIDKPYVLGRLFAVLESVQMDANLGITSTIRERYFNSASATPASVFPILLKLKNSHIKKIGREKEGKKIYYEKMIMEIMNKLDVEEGFPIRLSLEEQGKFALGYYHQTQKKYEKREEK